MSAEARGSAPPIPRRVGPRVRLAFPEPRDGEELIALHRASRRFHRGLASPPTTRAGFETFLQRSRVPDAVRLLIRRRADDAILGSIGISQIFYGLFRSAY